MRLFLYLFIFFSINVVGAQQLAFPTAYGAGAYSTGGRGGIVVHVTNLNDSGTGSLRSALVDYQDQDRTIVFDVSGVITLTSNIVLSSPDQGGNASGGITLAGQTAPLGGITITGGKIRMFGVDNVIARFMKFRETTATDGCFSNTDGSNVIFDHLSGSHSPDILFALTSNSKISDNKTIQNCLMAQSKNAFITGDTTPSSSTSYYEQVSILRNAYYNISHRIPLKGGGRIRVDAINNIAHNWSARLIRMDGYAYELNHIGNYYQGGYNTTNVLKHCSYLSSTGDPKIYNEDNYMDPNETTSAYLTDESVVWTEYQNNFFSLPSSYFVDTPNPIRGRAIPILSRDDLKQDVLPYVGAYKYLTDNGEVAEFRDAYDTAHINGIDIDDNSSRSTSISTPFNVPSNTRPGNFDTDNDGMADAWEVREFGDLTQDNNGDYDSDGYTNLEAYLNQVDGDAPIINVPLITRTDSNPTTIVLGDVYTPPTGTWTDVEDGSGTATVSGDTIPVDGSNNTTTLGDYNVLLEHTDLDGNTGSLTVMYSVIDSFISVTGVSLSQNTSNLVLYSSLDLDVAFSPSNASDQTGTWASSNNTVATINQNGVVTPVTEGSTTISYTSNDGNFTDTCVVTVIANSVLNSKGSKRKHLLIIGN